MAVVIGIVLLIAMTLGLHQLYGAIESEFSVWTRLIAELGLWWPAGLTRFVQSGFRTGAGLVFVLAPLTIGLVSLIWCSRSKGGMLCWFPGIVLLGGLSAVALIMSVRNLDPWLAEQAGVELPLDAQRFREQLDLLEDPESAPIDVQRARGMLHLLSMKASVHLIRIEAEDLERLIALAADESRPPAVRVPAARALLNIDHESPQACQAIGSAFRAGLTCDDPDIVELALRYVDHPCVEE
jgi:hypothetical protein